MMHDRSLAALLVITLLMAGTAQAASIKSPIVHQGEAEFEVEVEATDDKDSNKAGEAEFAVAIGYGVTDFWFFEIESEWARDPGSRFKHKVLGLENRFQILPQGEYLLDVGFYAKYEFGTRKNAADELTLGPIFQHDVGDFRFTANPFLSVEVDGGTDAAPEFKYGLRAQYLLHKAFMPSVEFHGNTGEIIASKRQSEQTHQLGPVVSGSLSAAPLGLPGKFGYEIGVLFGLTDATPDQTYKAKLEYEFAF